MPYKVGFSAHRNALSASLKTQIVIENLATIQGSAISFLRRMGLMISGCLNIIQV